MIVWSYWEGTRPQYITTCLESMRRVCRRSEFILVTPETMFDYIHRDDLPPNFANFIHPANRANVLRVALLARHGGLWCDADSVGLQDPAILLDEYPDASVLYAMWSNPPPRVLNGYIYSDLQTGVARQWLGQIHDELRRDFDEARQWTRLGETILTPIVPTWPGAVQVPLDTFLPIEIDCNVEKFFEQTIREGEFWELLQEYTVLFGLNHSYFMHRHGHEMVKQVREWHGSPLLIHKILAYAHAMNRGVKR